MDTKDIEGNTPLHVVTDECVAAVLIGCGGDPNAKNDVGLVPMNFARNGGIATVLLANGTNVNAAAGTGLDAIHCVKKGCVAFGDACLLCADPNKTNLCNAKDSVVFRTNHKYA